MKGDKLFCIVERSSGCDAGAYTLYIKPAQDLYFDVENLDMVREEIYEHLDECQPDGCTEVLLMEDGEQEDVFWNGYYTTVRIKAIDPEDIEGRDA